MIKATFTRTLVCGALALSGMLASLQPAEAAPVRVRFTPPYGDPFPNLEWFGEAVVDDGSCTSTGSVSNLSGSCAGQFSIVSATVNFTTVGADITNPANVLQSLHFTGAQVLAVERDTPAPPDWHEIVSTPFNTLQGNISETLYDPDGPGGVAGTQAYFSLVFVGGYAQLYWFQNDPGNFLNDPLSFPYVQWPGSAYYALCYAAGAGDNQVGNPWLGIPYNHCGVSDNVGPGSGGGLSFSAANAVPEPGTLALALAAGLGATGLRIRRRNRRA